MRTCKLCGKALTKWQRAYCSDECFRKHTKAIVYEKKCKKCKKKFETTYQRQIYCSKDCETESREVVHPLHTCDYCGDSFRREVYRFNKKHNKKYCSQKCMGASKSKELKKEKQKVSRECQYCGKVIEKELLPHQIKVFNKLKYCNTKCYNLERWENNKGE